MRKRRRCCAMHDIVVVVFDCALESLQQRSMALRKEAIYNIVRYCSETMKLVAVQYLSAIVTENSS